MMPFISLVVSGVVGLGFGLFYFGGLWLTLRSLPSSRWPTLVLLGSYVGRTAFVLVGFYLVMGGRWERALGCLVGFIAARQLLVYRLRPEPVAVASAGNEEL